MISVKTATTPDDLQACLSVRAEVFIVEQRIPEQLERDEYDATALHFIARDKDRAVGTARVLLKQNGAIAKIGRVAVLKPYRGQGIGQKIIETIEACPALASVTTFALEAQTHALPFYTRLGYAASGETFMDAGMPHRHMHKANRHAPSALTPGQKDA